jgi:hypothetical protein
MKFFVYCKDHSNEKIYLDFGDNKILSKNDICYDNFKILAENSLLFKGEMKGVIHASAFLLDKNIFLIYNIIITYD